VASAARLALANARLRAQARAHLEEVRASRQRLAGAADREQQRLERDLRDGAEQHLWVIARLLTTLRARLDGPADRRLVDELQREVGQAIDELRATGRGLRPAVLTEHGLGPALVDLARRVRIPVTLDLRPLGRTDPAVEATAYYVVSEALQNAVKHAAGAAARVQAEVQQGWLCVTVADDGPGGVTTGSGSGLHGLADRAAAVGGWLRVVSPPGEGTVVSARLPYAEARAPTTPAVHALS
jgi:signal transduction histidine kinase